MKFTTRQDIEASLEFVYAQMVDFEQFERMAMRRGAEVDRTDHLTRPGPGMAWRLKFEFKGKPRKVVVRLADLAENSMLDYGLDSPMLEGGVRIELMSLAPRRTRMTMVAELRPKTLGARVMMQSVKLARRRVEHKFHGFAGNLAMIIEERWRISRNEAGPGSFSRA